MEFLLYIIVSVILAIIFFPVIRQYDGPDLNNGFMNRFEYNREIFYDDEEPMTILVLRSMLRRGSLFRVCWLLIGWVGMGIWLFFGDNKLQGFPPVIAVIAVISIAFPWGFGLAIAFYNFRKWLNKKL